MPERLGKTRQNIRNTRGWLGTKAGPPGGILNAPPTLNHFRLSRRKPAPELAQFVEHYWIVSWDLRERAPHTQETLPQPNVQVVFERDNSHVFGVMTSKFSRCLEGKSHVFGIRFAPGMFRSFLCEPVSQLTDRATPVSVIFGNAVTSLETILTSQAAEEELVDAANSFFLRRIPKADEKATLAKDLVRLALERRDLLTVEMLALEAGLGTRTLERLFREYIGVTPKWVIRRFRLLEVVERSRAGVCPRYAQLATELGYFDQAHLINDFRSIVGYTPTQFRNGSTHAKIETPRQTRT